MGGDRPGAHPPRHLDRLIFNFRGEGGRIRARSRSNPLQQQVIQHAWGRVVSAAAERRVATTSMWNACISRATQTEDGEMQHACMSWRERESIKKMGCRPGVVVVRLRLNHIIINHHSSAPQSLNIPHTPTLAHSDPLGGVAATISWPPQTHMLRSTFCRPYPRTHSYQM